MTFIKPPIPSTFVYLFKIEIMAHHITRQLIEPLSIVVVGGSNNIHKPGGKILKNILDGRFRGKLYIVNPREEEIQGIKCHKSVEDLPEVDLAILAIAAGYCLEAVKVLTASKNTKAFIIISAGFSEESECGKVLENEIVSIVEKAGASLIGPNCIGVMTPFYQGVFTLPIPKLSPDGCDFISGSGATAVFIMESGMPKGLTFSSVFSVGNSALIGVEDMVEYLDETFDPKTSSRVKILYIESVNKPEKLLKHAASLIKKGCRIAAIKAGSSEAGSRAASSHTGAIASSDLAVDALFRKAGIVRCYSREELSTVAGIFMHPELKGKNIAIVTHAGGPAVMLTDALSEGGMTVPHLEGPDADNLLKELFPGSSVANPIDILATGTAEQVGIIIDTIETKFPNIDAIMIIFGSAGLSEVYDVYGMIDEKMKTCKKPIFPILPSIRTAGNEVKTFLSKGRINFPDEVIIGKALTRVVNTPKPAETILDDAGVDIPRVREIISGLESGYISDNKIRDLLDAAGISRVSEGVIDKEEDALKLVRETGYPVVMKVVGPLHKSDVGGVSLNIDKEDLLLEEMKRMKNIEGYKGLLIQPMLYGIELFLGASFEEKFGHLILCGLGGIFVEVIKDVASGLAPLNHSEALSMIRSLKSYKIIQGIRGKEGADEDVFADIIVRLSVLLKNAPEIKEMDLNPLMAKAKDIKVVDSRIRIEK
jgi:acyl-CoA synthetase (NDP forming)